jgi:tetratricopeptide (TPR) repeat protein
LLLKAAVNFMNIQNYSRSLSPQKKIVAAAVFLGIGLSIAYYATTAFSRPNPWQYRFQRPEVGSVTKNIQQEIAFHQQRIQQQPTAGLERASLASSYLKMARATGDSSWYLLAEQTAQQSLSQLSVNNYGAILVLAKIAAAKHDFPAAKSLLKQIPPQSESLALLTTIQLAVGDSPTAQQTANALVQRVPTMGNYALKALAAVARGQDQAAIQDFKAAIAAEESDEAGSSAWIRTLLGRLYYKRGQLQQADELYRSALQILPQYPPALLNSAELAVRKWQSNPKETQHLQRATEIYRQFFLTNQQAPTVYDHVALRGLARIQRLQGETTQANKTWERAVARLRSDLNGFGHRRELAQLLMERGQEKDLTEALALMQAEIKTRQDPETWDTLAAAYLRLKQLPDAEKAMQTALKSGIRDAGIADRAAAISSARGDTAQAKKYQELVKSIDPLFNVGAKQALGLGVGLSGLN